VPLGAYAIGLNSCWRLQMKTVYLVRHGESETNAGNIMFGKSAKLTARGHEQAKFIARRCATLPIQVIISSGFLRADETARYIVDAVAKPLEQSDLLQSAGTPASIWADPKVNRTMSRSRKAFGINLMINHGGTRMPRISKT
jgi:bisphosphoglycerate-dependent phosphoglycerate mutase